MSSRDLLASLLPPFDLEAVNSSHSRDKHSAEASVYSTQYLVSGREKLSMEGLIGEGGRGTIEFALPTTFHIVLCFCD